MAAMNRGAAICGVFAILMTCLIAVPMYFKLRNRFVQTNKNATSSRHTTDDFLTEKKQCRFIHGSRFTFKNDVRSSKNPWLVQDLNSDHRDEIILIASDEGDVYVCEFEQDGSFYRCQNYPSEKDLHPVDIIVADLNHDHRLDIAFSSTMSDRIRIQFNRGDMTFRSQSTFNTGKDTEPEGFVATDLNNDQYTDLIIVTSGTNDLTILFGDENAGFTRHRVYSLAKISELGWIRLADFNGDALLDLLFWDLYQNEIAIMFGLGNGDFDLPRIFDTDPANKYSSISIGDLNDDGHSDLVIVSDYQRSILVLLGSKNKTLIESSVYEIEGNVDNAVVNLALINDDDHLDLVLLVSSVDHLQVFFGFGDGTFSKQTEMTHEPINSLRDFAFGHFDDDNRSDIAVLTFDQTTEMHILLNQC